MKQMNKTTAAVMSFTLLGSLLAGCSSGDSPAPSSSPGASTNPSSTPVESDYPEKLSYWVALNANAAATMQSYNEIGAYKEKERITGTRVEFQHPPAGQGSDQFNLMFNSNNLPDVIEYTWTGSSLPKGPDAAIKEQRIIRLNELIDEHAPNLKKILDENPDYLKLITTDEGNIYTFPFLRGDEFLLVYMGVAIRQDWLDQLNLPMPVTLDDWEKTLTAFRDNDLNGNGQQDEIPLLISRDFIDSTNAFIGAFGITHQFYQENGQVKYGPMEPEYKEFLTLMNKWYTEGLIDQDYVTTDGTLRDAKMTGEQLGAVITYVGSGVGRYNDLMEESNPSFKLVGAPYPVKEEGMPSIGQYEYPFTGIGASITVSASNPEAIVRWLDFNYSEEGHMLFNFGIEGESYELEGDYPRFTDTVMNNPDGLPITQAMARYNLASFSGPFLHDKRYSEQYNERQEQIDAINAWLDADHSKVLPPLQPSAEDSSRYASIMNDVKTYRDEMFDRFVMGTESLDDFDKFVETLKTMGIEEAIQIQQAALDRFNAR
ncbi:extracellular solute-binding protein [Paenibacillus senegalensis]|uniref:extracellular solute-binding protein n=1 Tax=Paenibacillus senegalensis TaxID=1465766 RepID=UPI000287C6F6|nr:extracellular solute-binding protein [Paenibacillus senegalensis]